MESLHSTTTLQDAVVALSDERREWISTLPFPVCDFFSSVVSQCDDILQYVSSAWKGQFVYFCSKMYPPEGGMGGQGWKSLRLDLCRSALDRGYNLTSNGASGNNHRLVCSCSRQHRLHPETSPIAVPGAVLPANKAGPSIYGNVFLSMVLHVLTSLALPI